MSTAIFFTQLEQVVVKLQQKHMTFNELAKKQRDVLLQNRSAGLAELDEDFRLLAAEISDLEDKRISLMDALQKIGGQEILNVRDLPKVFPEACPESLISEVANLKTILQESAKLSKTNQALIFQGRQLIHSTLAIITGIAERKPSDSFNTYGKAGRNTPASRQVSSLINKRG